MQRKQSIAPWAGLSRKKLGKQQSHTERLRKEDAERRLPLRYAQTMESPPGLGQEGRMGLGVICAEVVEQRRRAGQSPGDPPCKYWPSPSVDSVKHLVLRGGPPVVFWGCHNR